MEHSILWAWNDINNSTVLKKKINCLSKNIYVDKTCTKIDYMSKTAHGEQQVFSLVEQLASIPLSWYSRCCSYYFFCVRLRFALSSPFSFWLYSQCCMFLQIVNLWFLFRFSLTFSYISKTDILNGNQKHIFPAIDIRVVFTLICFVKGWWFVYVTCIYLRIPVSNTIPISDHRCII